MHKLLPRIAERDSAPRVALDAARHLSTCGSCAAELLRLREMNGLLDRLPMAEVPASFPGRVLRALRTRGGAGAILLALLAAGTGGGAITVGGGSGKFVTMLVGPAQAASGILATLARTVLTILAALQETLLLGRFQLGHSQPWPSTLPQGVLILTVMAALAFAGAWVAFALGALRFRREQRPGRIGPA